ncbi:MAG TPA: alpha/beta hydrolase-fold protein [Anaerolineaceae bacterium]|nr:alpha/beta hydrolase-fold protein [Anaerolineaceae bacterium]
MRRAAIILIGLYTCLLLVSCGSPNAGFNSPDPATLTPPPLPTVTAPPTSTPTPQNTPTSTPVPCSETTGRIVNIDIPTDKLNRPVNTNIYLPPCYDPDTDGGYPMLVMFHGQAATNEQWLELGLTSAANDLISKKEIIPLIIVMPFEVTWTPGPKESQFDEALIEDVLPYIEANYAVCSLRTCRAVGGLSRGGNWAVHLGFAYPDLFGIVGAHSTPLFYGELWNIQAAAGLPPDKVPLLVVDAGDRDAEKDKIQEFITALKSAGIPYEFFEFEGRHETSYWSAHVAEYLRWYSQRFILPPQE